MMSDVRYPLIPGTWVDYYYIVLRCWRETVIEKTIGAAGVTVDGSAEIGFGRIALPYMAPPPAGQLRLP